MSASAGLGGPWSRPKRLMRWPTVLTTRRWPGACRAHVLRHSLSGDRPGPGRLSALSRSVGTRLAYVAGIVLGLVLHEAPLCAADRLWGSVCGTRPRLSVDDLVVYVALGIVIGGRLGYVLFYNFVYYLQNPIEIVAAWKGGMAFQWRPDRHDDRHLALRAPTVESRDPFGRRTASRPWCRSACSWGASPISSSRSSGAAKPTCPGRWCFPGGGDIPRHPSQLYEAGLEGIVLFVVLAVAIRLGALAAPRPFDGPFCHRLRRWPASPPNSSGSPIAQLGLPVRGRHDGDAAVRAAPAHRLSRCVAYANAAAAGRPSRDPPGPRVTRPVTRCRLGVEIAALIAGRRTHRDRPFHGAGARPSDLRLLPHARSLWEPPGGFHHGARRRARCSANSSAPGARHVVARPSELRRRVSPRRTRSGPRHPDGRRAAGCPPACPRFLRSHRPSISSRRARSCEQAAARPPRARAGCPVIMARPRSRRCHPVPMIVLANEFFDCPAGPPLRPGTARLVTSAWSD